MIFPTASKLLRCTLVVLLLAGTASHVGAVEIEVGFSPSGSAEQLVLSSIASAKKTIHLAAYSFTSPRVVAALIAAKKRGVDVEVVVDHKHNTMDTTGKAKAALNLLVNAKIPTGTVAVYAIQHSKYIVVDSLHVQTGSYNYSAGAATKNAENVVMLWNAPGVAKQFEDNWRDLKAQSQPYSSTY